MKRNIPFEIVSAINVTENIRFKYLKNKDRLELNSDRTFHEQIFKSYSVIVPELVNGIFSRLDFFDWVVSDEHHMLAFKSILNDADCLLQLQSRYEESPNRQEVDKLCEVLMTHVWHSVVTLKTLETAL
ncbi:hypothetical protein IM792_16240 [Mucilaginibacter sp. JRF]|uniref:hypothetical protein n=1 Tax=Mucilaginibacter sp. JRF TaxID=2780088 RepID=UPI00188148A8|nr:hypothetical protein [Mucilaginibacter sp. JRF]MBE9586004.1 hypothetical protein [Mucilaginibacter sp. JRF]